MTTDHSSGPTVTLGEHDTELEDRLTEELIAFNTAATGVSDRGTFSAKVTDEAGELVGGLTAWTWGTLCGIELLWVREDRRKDGWGSTLLQAAEREAQRRGCDRVAVSSFTFQAPGFYQRHGYVEFGRIPGIPGGHADVHLLKSLTGSGPSRPF
ncbi:GNAT family N-acetyltransferase [Streptomyces sp. NPDC091268]|uniref:GNAT family N-acetyltransferase n=1 Tax=Streptomyces sp. NPDC091268 TaxID=3365979 RepID=UPI003827FA5D